MNAESLLYQPAQEATDLPEGGGTLKVGDMRLFRCAGRAEPLEGKENLRESRSGLRVRDNRSFGLHTQGGDGASLRDAGLALGYRLLPFQGNASGIEANSRRRP